MLQETGELTTAAICRGSQDAKTRGVSGLGLRYSNIWYLGKRIQQKKLESILL
jgi:hypothetical protein